MVAGFVRLAGLSPSEYNLPMRILIIGGAGYIGSHVVREFLDQGHSVQVFDNLSSGLRENLQPGAGFTHGDILQFEQLRKAMTEHGPFDAAVHLAAFKAAGESMLKPEKYSLNNLGGTINILNAMTETGISKLVFSSSAAVYGEPQYLPIDERHPTNPENYYGFTKLEIERILAWYSQLKGLHFAALRYFNAAGYDLKGRIAGLEQNPANLLPVLMEAATGRRPQLEILGTDYPTPDGTGVRDYVHVTDLARAHVLALGWITAKRQNLTVNLGSENGISVREMLTVARRISTQAIPAIESPRRAGDPAKLVASSAFAAQTLNWKAEHSDVETLIRTTWQAYSRTRS
jgi:UDP-glucose 4-epimerase